jgi:type IV secretion system protein VirD4
MKRGLVVLGIAACVLLSTQVIAASWLAPHVPWPQPLSYWWGTVRRTPIFSPVAVWVWYGTDLLSRRHGLLPFHAPGARPPPRPMLPLQPLMVAFSGIFASMIILRVGFQREQHDERMGSARWASAGHMRRAGLFQTHGVILGQIARHYLRHDGPEHILLVGPTRSGKGCSTIIPTLLTWRESALILDPKDGENYDVTAGWRRTLGPVYAFTPQREAQAKINVLDTVRLHTPREFGDAQLIAQSLTSPEKLQHESQTSLHFRELASLLLTATILHVLYVEPRKSLAGVWDFLTQHHDSLAACLQAMTSTAPHSQGVHHAIRSMTTAIKNITGDRELSSVWTTAIRPLVLYSDPLVATSTDSSDVEVDALQYGDTPVSLYLIAPSPMALERLHPLYRVILDVAMMRLSEHKLRTCHYRLLNCCDELPWYGYSRSIDKGIAVRAGYGQKDLLVTQDLESLWEVYGEHTAIWGNCDVKIFHRPANDLTAKRISENILGCATVDNPVEQRSPIMGRKRSVSMQHYARSLMTTDELMDLPADEEIIRIGGTKPIRARKCDYRADRYFRNRLLPHPCMSSDTIDVVIDNTTAAGKVI